MIHFLAVGLGGFVGAIARYGLSSLVQSRLGGDFPAGTLLVNVLGCFLAGALWTLVEERNLFSENARLFAGVGLLGSMTTFSTFGQETVALLREGELRFALLSVALNVAVGLVGVVLGHGAARLAS